MAKRKREISEAKIEKWEKQGRGMGNGSEYKPWLNIHDVPSLGRSSRIIGWKSKRIHHFLSDLETNYFLLLEWSDKVVDIREQISLRTIEETIQIAEELNIKHPTDPKTKNLIVMTTDFLITIKDKDRNIDIARTCKYAKDLDDYRTIEKLEIERRYWEKKILIGEL